MLGRHGRIESSKKSLKECSASICQGSKVVFLDEHATDTFKIATFYVYDYIMTRDLIMNENMRYGAGGKWETRNLIVVA